MLPILMFSEMDQFFLDLIYGPASYVFIAVFIAFMLTISYKVKYFSLFAIGCTIFQLINYTRQTDITNLHGQMIMLGFSTMPLFWILGRDLKR